MRKIINLIATLGTVVVLAGSPKADDGNGSVSYLTNLNSHQINIESNLDWHVDVGLGFSGYLGRKNQMDHLLNARVSKGVKSIFSCKKGLVFPS